MSKCQRCGALLEGAFCGECGTPAPPVESARPSKITRPAGTAFVYWHRAIIAQGSSVAVQPDDIFLGIRFGTAGLTLEEGRHTLEDELESGFFVRRDGVELLVSQSLGELRDNHDNRAKVSISAKTRLLVDEPGDFVTHVISSGDLDLDAMIRRVKTKVGDLVDHGIRDVLAKDRYFTSLASTKITGQIREEVRAMYAADGDRDPSTAITLGDLRIQCEIIAEPEPMSEATDVMEALPSAPTGFANGARVLVVGDAGQRHPAVVTTTGCLVTYEGGHQQWVPLTHLESGLEPDKGSTDG